MWGLGCLMWEIFSGSLSQVSALRNTSKVSIQHTHTHTHTHTHYMSEGGIYVCTSIIVSSHSSLSGD